MSKIEKSQSSSNSQSGSPAAEATTKQVVNSSRNLVEREHKVKNLRRRRDSLKTASCIPRNVELQCSPRTEDDNVVVEKSTLHRTRTVLAAPVGDS